MKDISTKKNWLSLNIQAFVDPLPIPLMNDSQEANKSEPYYIKDEIHRNTTSYDSYMYKYKVALFQNWQTIRVPTIYKRPSEDPRG